MKSKPLSVGKFFLPGLLILGACSIATKDRGGEASETSQSKLESEVSLLGDRQSIEELRKDIPEAKRTDNDLLAETLALLGEVKEPPRKHRERFDKLIRRIRNDHQKNSRRTRDEYTRNAKAKRDEFYAKAKEEREEFLSDKPDRDSRKKFMDKQDRLRSEFRADEKDKRAQFDSNYRDQEKDFNEMVRDKTKDFHNELRLYEKRYQDWVKSEAAAKDSQKKARQNNYEPLKAGE